MYFVIVGATRIGASLAKWLLEKDHEVTLIDREAANCDAVNEELGSVTVLGDGTESGVLLRAGANRADALIAATARDDENLVACQMARHRFGIERIVAVVNVPDHERLFDLLGVGVTISTTGLVVNKMQEELSVMLAERMGSA